MKIVRSVPSVFVFICFNNFDNCAATIYQLINDLRFVKVLNGFIIVIALI